MLKAAMFRLRIIEQTTWGEVRLAQQRYAEAYQHFQTAERLTTPDHVLLQTLIRYELARAAAALSSPSSQLSAAELHQGTETRTVLAVVHG